MYLKAARPDMAEGCEEKLDLEFVSWVWNHSKITRPRVLGAMRDNSERKQIIRLRSRSDVESFLQSMVRT